MVSLHVLENGLCYVPLLSATTQLVVRRLSLYDTCYLTDICMSNVTLERLTGLVSN